MTVEELLPVLRALTPRGWSLVEDAKDGCVKLAVPVIPHSPAEVLRGLWGCGVEVGASEPYPDTEYKYAELIHVNTGICGTVLHWRPGSGFLFDPVRRWFAEISDGPGCCPVSRLRAVTGGAA